MFYKHEIVYVKHLITQVEYEILDITHETHEAWCIKLYACNMNVILNVKQETWKLRRKQKSNMKYWRLKLKQLICFTEYESEINTCVLLWFEYFMYFIGILVIPQLTKNWTEEHITFLSSESLKSLGRI